MTTQGTPSPIPLHPFEGPSLQSLKPTTAFEQEISRTSIWDNWLKDKPPQHPGVKVVNSFRNLPRFTYRFIALCASITLITILASIGLVWSLTAKGIKGPAPLASSQSQIDLAMNLIAVDPIAGTLVLDWYPNAACPSFPLETYCIYFDPNLSATPNPNKDDPTNTAVADNLINNKATFCFNPREYCAQSPKNSFPTFRTNSKLNSRVTDGQHLKASLEAYPYDLYIAQISMFALSGVRGFNDTTVQIANATQVGMRISQTWGVVVGFEVQLELTTFSSQDQGLYFIFNVSRSRALISFVLLMVVANWLVAIIFLWITIALAYWKKEVVKETFLAPVSVLFAFAAVRSSIPGSPAGFGAFIDLIGVLPNLVVLTICSCTLFLFGISNHIKEFFEDQEEPLGHTLPKP